jgi:hypothetical protein
MIRYQADNLMAVPPRPLNRASSEFSRVGSALGRVIFNITSPTDQLPAACRCCPKYIAAPRYGNELLRLDDVIRLTIDILWLERAP